MGSLLKFAAGVTDSSKPCLWVLEGEYCAQPAVCMDLSASSWALIKPRCWRFELKPGWSSSAQCRRDLCVLWEEA